ncbi:MAG: putative toxin-antitoxin system toxin component, PIN family [Calditrichaeota bacterium]|nr:putative toxin-antitoxin system toxin component, PIN family [Calditrichota bacterium]
MKKFKIVIDTNVLISALRSRKGASFKLFSLLDSNKFILNISVPLLLEYESIAIRELDKLNLTEEDINDFLDYICTIGNKCKIYYLWRPYLKDIKDDFVLELAFNSESDFIITYNKRDFKKIAEFGINVLNPKEFIEIIEVIK